VFKGLAPGLLFVCAYAPPAIFWGRLRYKAAAVEMKPLNGSGGRRRRDTTCFLLLLRKFSTNRVHINLLVLAKALGNLRTYLNKGTCDM
jgi:hypothetical protein